MSINNNAQEPGKTNTNEVHNDQHEYASVQIGILPEQQDDQSSLTVHFKSSASMTLDKGYRGDKLVTFTSSSLRKYPS